MSEDCTILSAQREMRGVYLDGSVGQAVSALVWLASAAAAGLAGQRAAILLLVVGGMFIFPLTQGTLRLAGRPASVSRDNPLRPLAVQVAFMVPLLLPVAGAAALHEVNWFYPAVMMIVGAHYLPFMTLFGRGSYGLLAAVLLGGGLALGLWGRESFSAGGWATGIVLLVFAAWTGFGPAGAGTQRSPGGRR